MSAAIVIPARYESSRFPGKPLAPILGRPMILWVVEACTLVSNLVYVVTDSARIAKVVRAAGFDAIMTGEAATGTDRIAAALSWIKEDVIINVQGDEPTIDSLDIRRIAKEKEEHPLDVINGYCEIGPDEDPTSVNIPKVVFDETGRMLYMSRALIPGHKSSPPHCYHKQVCIYAFSREDLERFAAYGRKSTLETSEDIEVLRFLEWGTTVRMVETSGGSLAVDEPHDIPPVEKRLKEMGRVDQ